MTEREKMLAGEMYDAGDAELLAARGRAADLCRELRETRPAETARRRGILARLLASGGDSADVQPPFHRDYGSNIRLGRGCYFNVNCVVLDVCEVRVGDRCFFGPGVQIYAATHPVNPVARRTLEYGRPVTVGDDVWVGGAAILCPGVSVGSRSVVGAGSVVTRDVPDGVVAAGNPCRVIRPVD